MSEPVSQIATRVYATYRAAALRQIMRGTWTRTEAAARLCPWAAIAARCWGEVPGYTDSFDELYPSVVELKVSPVGAAERNERHCRLIMADDLCPDNGWRPVLARAHAEALIRADELRDGDDPEAFCRAIAIWRDLDTLADYLGLPLRQLYEAQVAISAPERVAA